MERGKTRACEAPLAAEQELAAALLIEDTEIAHWSAILSHLPALPIVRAELAQQGVGAEMLARIDSLASASDESGLAHAGAAGCDGDLEPSTTLAQALRDADSKRLALVIVDAALRRALAGDPRAAAFLLRLSDARRAQQRAKHDLVVSNIALVRYFARRSARAAPMAELVQEGCLALMRAVELYDHRRGVRFSTYAVWWIRQAQNLCVSEQMSAVRAPVGALNEGHRIDNLAWAVYGRTGNKPERDELTEETVGGYKAYAGPIAHRADLRTTSLDESVHVDSNARRIDQLSSGMPRVEGELDMAMLRHTLELGLAKLPVLEATILRQKFGLLDGNEGSLRSIAKRHQLSYDRARTLCEQAMRKLKREFEHLGIVDLSCCPAS